MRKLLIIAALLLVAGVAFSQAQNNSVIVGTFDSRVIAVAYYNSDAHKKYVEGLKTEYADAEASGNTELARELEALGEASQELAHKQAFSTWPVDNILETIEGKIPEIAEQTNVDLIISKWDIIYQRSGVEFIDVTDVMVELFNLDDQFLKGLQQLKNQPPLPLEELEKMN
jgi:Skp family chaperone for outer membrane proteins